MKYISLYFHLTSFSFLKQFSIRDFTIHHNMLRYRTRFIRNWIFLFLMTTLGFYATYLIHQHYHSLHANRSGDVAAMIQGGEDADPQVRAKRDKVRQMMIHAWKGYVDHAWGSNELRPISKTSYHTSIFGWAPLGATIVDSIDTLYIMGLMNEYNQAKNWIKENFKPESIDNELSVFEITIRFLGGLLSAHALTKDELFYSKALELGKRILPAFDTPDGIPNTRINLAKKASSSFNAILAEWGTLSLEFNQLAAVSGSNSFRAPIQRLYKLMEDMERPYGLFPVYGAPLRDGSNTDMNKAWGTSGLFSLADMGDSFYEYLFKSWLQSDKTDETSKKLYLDAMEGATKKLMQTSKKSKLTYLGNVNNGQIEHKMGHLACFTGGMLALSGKTMGIKQHLELGIENFL